MSWSDFLQEAQWWVLSHRLYGNSLARWLLAAAVFLLLAVVMRILLAAITRRTERIAQGTVTEWDDALVEMLKATKAWFLLVLSAYLASLCLTLPEKDEGVINRGLVESVIIITSLLQAAIWGNVVLGFLIGRYVERRRATDGELVTTVSALSLLARIALWSIVLLMALANLNVDITALIAGLGVGGIAVALAAQNILGDLFASLSIVLDKPFVMGDFIIVGEQMGTVEKIGLKTTRLRSLSGEQLIFSNNDLLQSRIRNFKRMFERRVVFSLGVTYQTPREKLAAIPKMIRGIVEGQPKTRFDRCHFKEYGDSALIFETVYFVLVPDYSIYMDIQQEINLAIYRDFEANGIEFAYPTRTLFIQQQPPDGETKRSAYAS